MQKIGSVMVAVVTGQELGLFSSSLSSLGTDGAQGRVLHGRGQSSVYVNASTGNLIVQNSDTRVSGVGLDFGTLRTYNSQGTFNDGNGDDNWHLGFLSELQRSGEINQPQSTLTRITADGGEQSFTYNTSSLRYESTEGAGAHDWVVVSSDGSNSVYTEGASGNTQTFNASGKLVAAANEQGFGYSLDYNQGQLSSVTTTTSSGSETSVLNYERGNLASISVHNSEANGPRKVFYYGYDDSNRLASVTVDLSPGDNSIADGNTYVTSYTYHGQSDRIHTLTQTDGTSLTFGYDATGRVTSITDGVGTTTTYSYVSNTQTDVLVGGRTFSLTFDNNKRLTSKSTVVDGQLLSTSYQYTASGDVDAIIDGKGNRVDFGYDGAGNQTSQHDAEGNRIERIFDDRNNLVIETAFVVPDPDAAGPKIATETRSTRFVYDENEQLRFTVSPEGSVTELRYNSLGQNTEQRVYARDRFNVDALSHTQTLGLDSLVDWVSNLADLSYDSSAEQLGRSAPVIITALRYDLRGNLSESEVFSSIDDSGLGYAGSITNFVYDAQGRLLSEISPNDNYRSYSYDGLGRMLTSSDSSDTGVTALSVYDYDDSRNTTVLTERTGLQTVSQYDAAGRLVEVQLSQENGEDAIDFGSDRYFYDAQGRQIARKHSNGAYSFNFYDAAGRLAYQVDQSGALSTFEYDAANQITTSTVFSTQLSSFSQWLNGSDLKLDEGGNLSSQVITQFIEGQSAQSQSKNRTSKFFYDDAGRKIFDLVVTNNADQTGYVTEYRYDGMGRLTHTIGYAEIGDVSFSNTGVATVNSVANARIERVFYTEDGQLKATVDGEGIMTEYGYDEAGQQVFMLAYAEPFKAEVEAAELLSATFADLQPARSAGKDRVSLSRYNARAQKIIDVEPNGAVTRYQYNADGLLSTRTQYANRLSSVSLNQALVLPAADPAQDRVVSYSYNEHSQLETETRSYENRIISYIYDESNRLIGSTVSDTFGTGKARTNLTALDALGREIGQLNGIESEALPEFTSTSIAEALNDSGTERKFDSAGRLIESKDREGNSVYYYYNVRNQVALTISSNGEVQRFEYNAFGEVTDTVTYSGKLPVNALASVSGGDPTAALVANIDKLAGKTSFSQTYTNRGLVHTSSDETGGFSTRIYNAYGQLKETTTTLNGDDSRKDTVGYDQRGLIVSSTVDAGGENITATTRYDAFGRIVQSTDGAGNTTSFEHNDLAGTTITHYPQNAASKQETVAVDVFGRTVQITDATGRRQDFTYTNGNPKEVSVDGEGNATEVSYNEHGDVTDIRRGELNSQGNLINVTAHTHYDYDANGNRVSQSIGHGSADSITTEFVFDKNNRRTSEILDPDGIVATSNYRYDELGRVIAREDAEGSLTYFAYDGKGNLTAEIESDKSLKTFTYDAVGRLTSTSQYKQKPSETAAFDSIDDVFDGNLVDSWTEGLQAATSYIMYDESGRVLYTIDEESAVVENVYNTRGLVIERIEYVHPVTLSGELQDSLALGEANELPIAFSTQNRKTATVYDERGLARFSLTQSSFGGAIVKESQYDAGGRLVSTRAYESTLAYANDYTLDPSAPSNKNIASLMAGKAGLDDRQSWLIYDSADRLRFTVDAQGAVVESSYNLAGQLETSTSYSTPLSKQNLAKLKSTGLTLEEAEAAVIPNDNLDRVSVTTYDSAGRVDKVTDAEGHEESWTYYSNGNKKSFTNAKGDTWHYRYDDAGRLTREISPSLDEVYIESNGRHVKISDARLTTEIAYDDRGNVLSRKEGYIRTNDESRFSSILVLGGHTTTFGYDKKGRQNLVVESATDNAPRISTVVTYNALDQAVKNTISTFDEDGQPLTINEYKVYDDEGQLVYDIDAEGYVTSYGYNTFGQQTTVTRYQSKLNVTQALRGSADQTINHAAVVAQLSSLGSSRTVTSVYNLLGQKVRVLQPSVTYAEVNSNGVLRENTDQPETEHRYNVFGEVVLSRVKINSSDWAETYQFYNALGQRNFTVDAEGFVSEWTYNVFGDVSGKTEYAEALDSVSLNSVPSPEESADDRVWTYKYDELGRKTDEIQVSRRYHRVSSSAWTGSDTQPTATTKNIVTSTSYDEVGNVTSVTNAGETVYTNYDALGRVVEVRDTVTHIVERPESLVDSNPTSGGDGWSTQQNVTRRTQYHYDQYGNTIKTISGKDGQLSDGKFVLSETGDNRVIEQFFNDRGEVKRSIDAEGNETSFQLDYAGNVLSQSTEYSEAIYSDYQFSTYAVYGNRGGDFRGGVGTAPSWLSINRFTGRVQGIPDQNISFSLRIVPIGSNIQDDSIIVIPITARIGQEIDIPIENWESRGFAPEQSVNQATVRFTYDLLGQQLSQTNERVDDTNAVIVERHTQQIFNAFGETTFVGDAGAEGFAATSAKPLQVQNVYNAAGQLTATNAEDGANKTYLYDLRGTLVKSDHPGRGITINVSDKLGRVTSQIQASFDSIGSVGGVEAERTPTIRQGYDRWGNIVRFVDALGATTRYTYNHNNQVTQETQPLTFVTDENGQESAVAPTFRNYYDDEGQLIGRQDANGNYRFNEFTRTGQLSRTRDEEGAVTRFAYNVFGEQVAMRDAEGHITTTKFDKNGRVEEKGDIRTVSDSEERLTSIYQALNQFEYNELGHRTITRDALGNEFYYRTDGVGNVLSSLTPEGVSKEFAFDRQGRRTHEVFSGLGGSLNSQLNTNLSRFNYFGQTTYQNDLGGNEYVYRYENGLLQERTLDLREESGDVNQTITYSYEDNGLLRSISDDSTGSVTTFDYDLNGQTIVEERLATNALGETIHEKTTIVRDSHKRPVRVLVHDQLDNEKIVSAIEYTYDAMGNRRSMRVINGYTGSVTSDSRGTPQLNPEFEGLSYAPLPNGHRGTAIDLGDASNVFIDPAGEELEYFLVDDPLFGDENGDDVPAWLSLDQAALNEQPPRLVITSTGAVSGDHHFAIMAKRKDSTIGDGELVLLPIYLPVLDNVAPIFTSEDGFGTIEPLQPGNVYPAQSFDLNSIIEDPEGGDLTFTFVSSDSNPDVTQWFDVNTTDIHNGIVTLSTKNGQKVPSDFSTQLSFVITATDNQGAESEFTLSINAELVSVNPPSSNVTIKQKPNFDIDLLEFVSGQVDNVRFVVVEPNDGEVLISQNGSQGEKLSIAQDTVITDTERSITVEVHYDPVDDTEYLYSSFDITLDIDGRPRIFSDRSLIDRYLSDIVLAEGGSFQLPAFSDPNTGENLRYRIDLVPTNDDVTFELGAFDPSTETYEVTYTGANRLSADGTLRISAFQVNDVELVSDQLVVEYKRFNNPPQGSIDTLALSADNDVEIDFNNYFTDPEGRELSYRVEARVQVRTEVGDGRYEARTFWRDINSTIDSNVLTGGAPIANLSLNNGILSGEMPAADIGNYAMRVIVFDKASDGVTNDNRLEDTFTLAVTPNQAPTLNKSLNVPNAIEETLFVKQFDADTFTDPERDGITYGVEAYLTKTTYRYEFEPELGREIRIPVEETGWFDVQDTGWLEFNASTRTLTGTPDINEDDARLRLTAVDSNGNPGEPAEFTVVVNDIPNQDPYIIAPIDDVIIEEGQAVSIPLAGYFDDPDGDALTFSVSATPALSQLKIEGGKLVLSAAASKQLNGEYEVVVTAKDGKRGVATNTFTLEVTDNRAPVGDISTLSYPSDLNHSVDLSNFYRDPENRELSYRVEALVTFADEPIDGIGGPRNLSITEWININTTLAGFGAEGSEPVEFLNLNGSILSGLMPESAQGSYSLRVIVSDKAIDSDSVVNTHTDYFTLRVLENQPPEITADTVPSSMREDGSLTLNASHFSISDLDQTSGHRIEVLTGTNYTRTGSSVSGYQVKPSTNYYGPLAIKVRAVDAKGDKSDIYTVNLNVTPVNDAPRIQNNPDPSVDRDQPYHYRPNVSHVDSGQTLRFSISNKPSWANFNSLTGELSGTPERSDVGDYNNIKITVTDNGEPPLSDVKMFNLTVNAVNTRPSGQISMPDIDEGLTNKSFDITGSISDLDGDTITYSNAEIGRWERIDLRGEIDIVWIPASIPVRVSDDGVLTITTSYADQGDYNLRVTVSDGTTSFVSTTDFTIRNVIQNHAPVITNTPRPAIDEDVFYNYVPNISDANSNQTHTFTIENKPSWASFDRNTGRLSGTPRQEHVDTYENIKITVTDNGTPPLKGSVSFDITVRNVNDAPVITGENLPASINEDSSLSVKASHFTITDQDQASGHKIEVLTGSNYTRTGNRDSGYTVRPTANYNGPLVIKVRAFDAQGKPSAVYNVNLNVTPVNDTPTITNTPPVGANENGTYTYIPVVKDPDDGQSHSFSITNKPSWATFDTRTGILTGTPSFDDAGVYKDIRITVRDNGNPARSSSRTFSISVDNVNRGPVGSISVPNVKEGEVNKRISIVGTMSDPDDDTLTFSNLEIGRWERIDLRGEIDFVWIPSDIAASISADGVLTITTNYNHEGDYTLRVDVSDGSRTVSKTAGFSVTNVIPNYEPKITNSPLSSIDEDKGYNYKPNVTDANTGQTHRFSITNKPSWASFDTTTGRLWGTPRQQHVGTHSNIKITVSDNGTPVLSDSVSFNITVRNVNDAPVITGENLPSNINEDSTLTVNASHFTITDQDQSTGHKIEVLTGSNYTRSGNINSGYTVRPSANYNGPITLKVRAIDAEGKPSAVYNVRINVVAVNDSPRITNTPPTSVSENNRYTFTPIVSDPDSGQTHSFTIRNRPSWATFDSRTGTLSGTPDFDDAGTYSDIRIAVRDNGDPVRSTSRTFSITVNNINRGPTGSISMPDIKEGESNKRIDIRGSMRDPDGDTLEFSNLRIGRWETIDIRGEIDVVWIPVNLPATLSDSGILTISTNYNHQGDYTLRVDVSDGKKTVERGRDFKITNVVPNYAPNITNSPLTTVNEDSGYSYTPNITDANAGQTHRFSISNKPSWASFDSTTGRLWGTPRQQHVGTHSNIVITVSDNGTPALTDRVAFNITVRNVNDAPVITAENLPSSINEDSSLSVRASHFTISDQDQSSGHKIEVLTGSNYTRTGNRDSGYTVRPSANYNGPITVRVRALDAQNKPSAVYNVRINVVAVNDAPRITNTPPTSVNEKKAYSYTPNVSDADSGQTHTFSIRNKPSWASFDSLTGRLSGTPDYDDSGTYKDITITATDNGSPARSASRTFSITVTNINRGPTGSISMPNIKEGESGKRINIRGSMTDPDGDTLKFSNVRIGRWETVNIRGELDVVWVPKNLSASVSDSGTLTISTGYSDQGSYTLRVDVSDGTRTVERSRDFTITNVVPNYAPKITNSPSTSVNEDSGYSYTPNVSDSNTGQTHRFAITNKPSWASFDTSTGRLWGTPRQQHVRTYNNVTITVSDNGTPVLSDSVRFNLTVRNVNDAPVITGENLPSTINEDSALSVNASHFSITDQDQSSGLRIEVLTGSNYTRSGSPSSGYTVRPSRNYNGPITVRVRAIDSQDKRSAIYNVRINVAAVNDTPTITNTPPTSVNERSTYSYTPSVSDPDSGQTHTFSISNKPSWATFDSRTGKLSGTPGFDDAGTYSNVKITARDNGSPARSTTRTFSITVKNTNQGPTGSISVPSIKEGETNKRINIRGTMSDPDGDTLTFSNLRIGRWETIDLRGERDVVWVPKNLSASVSSSGTLTISTGYSDQGSYTLRVDVSDGSRTVERSRNFSITNVQPNRRPDLVRAIPDKSYFKNNTVGFSVASNFRDLDNDTLEFRASGLPTGLSISKSGYISGRLTSATAKTYNVTVTADDKKGGTRTDTFRLTVKNVAVNKAPVGSPPSTITVSTNRNWTGTLSNYFTDDAPTSELRYSISSTTLRAPLSRISNGRLTVENINFDRSDRIENVYVTATDAGSKSTTIKFTFRMKGSGGFIGDPRVTLPGQPLPDQPFALAQAQPSIQLARSAAVLPSSSLSLNSTAIAQPQLASLDVIDKTTLEVNDKTSHNWSKDAEVEPIDFNSAVWSEYASSQNKDDELDVSTDGKTLQLKGNTWKAIELPYQVTDDTMLSFEFKASEAAEIQAIGFETDNKFTNSGTTLFQLAGSQTGYSKYAYLDESYSSKDSEWQRFNIKVSDYYTGDVKRLVFISDDDAKKGANVEYRNVSVYEKVTKPQTIKTQAALAQPVASQPLSLDASKPAIASSVFNIDDVDIFSDPATDDLTAKLVEIDQGSATVDKRLNLKNYNWGEYASGQNKDNDYTISKDGYSLNLKGNTWKAIDLPYTVTKDTVLRFEFKTANPSEIQAIGFETDNNFKNAGTTLFQLAGSQTGYSKYAYLDQSYKSNGEWQTFEIKVSDYYEGDVKRLVFFSDDDAKRGAEVEYRDISVYEKTPNQAPIYNGPKLITVENGEFIRVAIPFTDDSNNDLDVKFANLPNWLSYDKANEELFGFAPVGGAQSINLNAVVTDSEQATTNTTIRLDVTQSFSPTIQRLNISDVSLDAGSSLSRDISELFADLADVRDYKVEVRSSNGSFTPLQKSDWLKFEGGLLSGVPTVKDVTNGRDVKITATDAKGNQVIAELRVSVLGVATKSIGTIAIAPTKSISIKASDYFFGLAEGTKFGVVLSASNNAAPLVSEPSISQPPLIDKPVLLDNTLVAARSLSAEPAVASVQSTQAEAPQVVIPPELASWLSFDVETGLLSGTPPEGFLNNLRIAFIAQEADGTQLSSEGELIVSEDAKEETYWFTYDKANRVVIDGGSLEGSNIGISSFGRYLEYDAVGRNTLSISNGGFVAQTMNYDAQGRLTSAYQTYDNYASDGQNLFDLRRTNTSQSQAAFNAVNKDLTVKHEYNILDQVTSTTEYFLPGTTKSAKYYARDGDLPLAIPDGQLDNGNRTARYVSLGLTGVVSQVTNYGYNGDGQVASTNVVGWAKNELQRGLDSYAQQHATELGLGILPEFLGFITNQEIQEHIGDPDSQLTSTVNSYDDAGRIDTLLYSQRERLDGQSNDIPSAYTHRFKYDYEGRQGYLEKSVKGSSVQSSNDGGGDFKPAETNSFYDANGSRTVVEEKDSLGSKISARYLTNSADGQLIAKKSGTQDKSHEGQVATAPVPPGRGGPEPRFNFGQPEPSIAHTIGFAEGPAASHYIHADGQYRGEMREDGFIRVKEQHFSGLDSAQGGSSQRHQVREGDTLSAIAVLYYGNADYWYIIADANGLGDGPQDDLIEGQSLIVPEQVNNQNRFDTFSTYSVAEQIGDTTPNLPFVPTPPDSGCNALVTVLIVAVTIVAAAATAGAAAGVGLKGGFGVLAGTTASTTAISTTAAAAIGGAVGSVAGQAVGIATGVQDGFSLKDIAVGAISAGLTAGAGKYLSGMSALTKGATSGTFNTLGNAVVAGAGTLSSAAANKIVGNPSGFSWASLAAAAGTAALAPNIPGLDADPRINGTPGIGLLADTAQGIARAGINYGIQKAVFNKGSWDFANVAADAFGNALGNSVVRAATEHRNNKIAEQEKLSAAIGAIGREAVSGVDKAIDQRIDEIQRQTAEDLNRQVDQKVAELEKQYISDSEAEFAKQESRQSQRSQDVIDSFYVSANNAYQRTASGIAAGLAAGDEVRARLSGVAAASNARRQRGNALAAQRFNAIGGAGLDAGAEYARLTAGYAEFRQGQRDALRARLGLASDAEFGTITDNIIGTVEGFADSIYQGAQFIGTAIGSLSPVVQGISYFSGNGAVNPFTQEYHSFLGEATTVQQAAGRQQGEILSYFAGAETVVVAGSKVAGLFGASRSSLRFNSQADPLFDTMGPAHLSHPQEYRAILDDLAANNVSVKYGEGSIAFSPNTSGGSLGNEILLPNDFSISALRHEYGHFLDHKALGSPRYIEYFKQPELILSTERRQYLGEIRTAREIGDNNARRILIENYLNERNYIVDRYYQRPYGGR